MSQTPPPDPQAPDPAAEQLERPKPWAGRPLVPGPAASVQPPIKAKSINTFFGIGAALLLLATLVVVVLLGIFVINLLTHR
jgi:hypothetical protein